MAHILCMTTGLSGMLNASLELVARLENSGHRVTYGCPWDVQEKIECHGFSYVQFPKVNFDPAPGIEEFNGFLARPRRIWKRIITASARRKKALNNLGTKEISNLLNEIKPDLLLLDIELHDHIITAVNRFPVILLSQWFTLWENPRVPPLTSSIIPGKGFWGSRMGIKLSWLSAKCLRRWKVFKLKVRTFGTDRGSILQSYARRTGFPTRLFQYDSWVSPFIYKGLQVVSLTTRSLEFPHEPRPNLQYAGAMVFDQRKESGGDPQDSVGVNEILTRSKEKGKKLILCTMTSMGQSDARFLSKLIQAVGRHQEWEMIIGHGTEPPEGIKKILPDNIHLFPWVPQLRILAEADCSINHGGIHTINECIHFKVPMLIYSGKKFDQNGCAARVAYHKIGLMANKDKDEVNDISEKVEMVITNDEFRREMEKQHHYYLKEKKENRIALIVDRLLADNKLGS